MKKAYFSNRIYKNTLSKEYVEAISHALLVFNRAKHFAFQTQVLEKRSGKSKRKESMQITVKTRFHLNDYYANSAVQEANSIMKSQTELQEMYVKNKEEQIKTVKNKITTTKKRLTTLRKIKESIIKGKPRFNKTSREQQKGNFFVVQFKRKTDIYYHVYQFEHEYLDVEIKRVDSTLRKLCFRLDRLQKQLKSIKNKTKSVVFGTKKLFKAKHTIDTYMEHHDVWLKDWEQSRYNQMLISGRKDAKTGNFVFSYNLDDARLHFLTPNGTPVALDCVQFPYGQDKVNLAVHNQLNCKEKKKYGKPISWALEDHGEYYIVKCLIDVKENAHKNHSKADGVLGVDCNVNHLAWSNINSKGQLIKSGVFSFDIEDKTSGQIDKILEAKAVVLVDLAVRLNKPIVVEKLDTTKSKVSNTYGNKKANKRMSLFAYKKMIDSIKCRAEKMGIVVYEVNPAYTSQIGKIKYMKRFGINIHQAASYVIARRAMGFKEKLPPVLYSLLPEKIVGLHHWAQWKYSSATLKSIRTCAFYRSELFDLAKFHLRGELFETGAFTDLEQKGLAKWKVENPKSS